MKDINLLGNFIVNGFAYIAVTINVVTFLHHEHNHHLYNFHFRKNRFLYQSKLTIKRMVSLLQIKWLLDP